MIEEFRDLIDENDDSREKPKKSDFIKTLKYVKDLDLGTTEQLTCGDEEEPDADESEDAVEAGDSRSPSASLSASGSAGEIDVSMSASASPSLSTEQF
jgi:hypothetical protein